MIFIKSINISIKKFEEAVGLSNGYINNLKSQPREENIQKIIQSFPNLNRIWLLTGEGDMLLPQNGNATTVNDNHTSVAGNSNQVNATSTLDKALDEIAAQRRLTEKAQEQIDRLISLLEKLQK